MWFSNRLSCLHISRGPFYRQINVPISVFADHRGRAVRGMNCPRPLEHWNCGFESHSRHGCLCAFILFVLSCAGSDLAKGWSPVQGVLPTVSNITKLKSGQGPTKDCGAIDIWTDICVCNSLTALLVTLITQRWIVMLNNEFKRKKTAAVCFKISSREFPRKTTLKRWKSWVKVVNTWARIRTGHGPHTRQRRKTLKNLLLWTMGAEFNLFM
jgi:hypothetical protein